MKMTKTYFAIALASVAINAHADLLISEVLYDAPNNDSTEEYIELFNASCQPIDLSSYQLSDNNTSLNLSGTLGSGDYLTVAANAAGFQSLFNSTADLAPSGISLGNSGDFVRLTNNGQEVDVVAWEGGITGWTISAKDVSLHRTTIINSKSQADWTVSSSAGTAGSGSLVTSCTINNTLQNGQAKTGLSASSGETLKFTADIPAGVNELTFTMSGGSGDADLYVRHGAEPTSSSYDCRPYLTGNNESCSISNISEGKYYVNISAYNSFSEVSLVASYTLAPIQTTPKLANGVAQTGLTAAKSEELLFTIDVPAGASNLAINTTGGSGDGDLYLKYATAPTTTSYDCRPYKNGNVESCTLASPQTGTYYVMVKAYSAFSGLSLTGSFTAASGGGNGEPTPPPAYDYNSYYATALGQTGSALKASLNQIIKGHVQFTYGQVWDGVGYADEDPNNSENVILLYTGRSEPKTNRAGMSSSQDAWNREHVWAKSHGFPDSSQYGYTDFHHIRPADVSVNSARGNKDFLMGGSEISEAPGNNTDTDSFEPMDSVKGDVARMVFYMDVRYEGNDNSGTPDLSIATGITSVGQAALGDLCTLLAWHLQDPVSDWERRRNNRIYEWQHNRNPFIDNPQWASELYSNSCN